MDIVWITLAILAFVTVSWLGWRMSSTRRHPPKTTEQRLIEADMLTRITRHF